LKAALGQRETELAALANDVRKWRDDAERPAGEKRASDHLSAPPKDEVGRSQGALVRTPRRVRDMAVPAAVAPGSDDSGVAPPKGFDISAAREFSSILAMWFPHSASVRLLYSADRREWAAGKWHAACDGRAPTLTLAVIDCQGVECIIGGFTGVPWTNPSCDKYVSDPIGRTFVFALRNARRDKPYRLRARAGAVVLRHSGARGPIFQCGGGQWLLAIGGEGAYAEAPKDSAWDCCPDARAGMEMVGLVADGFEYAPLARVESWLW
jgi:hypothetical protein